MLKTTPKQGTNLQGSEGTFTVRALLFETNTQIPAGQKKTPNRSSFWLQDEKYTRSFAERCEEEATVWGLGPLMPFEGE